MLDMIVVGKGPAGWSCAMTARLRGLQVIVVAPQKDAGWLAKAERIDNYPGLPEVSGADMLGVFAQQATALGVEERAGLVRQIMPNGQHFMVLVENDVLECKTVVLTTGAARASLLPGEEPLIGRGVSYCATCDGMFYRGKRIAVLSASEQGVEEANFLAELVADMDYYPLKKHDASTLSAKAQVLAGKPTALEQKDGQLWVSAADQEKPYDGIFIFRTSVPLTTLLPNLETEGAFIKVSRAMDTNIPGIFAAGDCTGKPLQIAKAVGEGNIAAISAAEYIAAHG